jgi:UDP-glucose 4-epimerase
MSAEFTEAKLISKHQVRRDDVAVGLEIGGVRVPTVEAARRPGDPPTLVSRQGQSLLGWCPSKSGVHDIIRTGWNWHTQRGSPGTEAGISL